jgi:restriction system protein
VGGMETVWGIHNTDFSVDFVALGEIAIGWAEMGDLSSIVQDREQLRQQIRSQFPAAKDGAIPIWAGILIRYVAEMREGDLVVYPNRTDSTIAVGRVAGPYEYRAEAGALPNRRRVVWLRSEIPRSDFSQGALYEVGSAMTLFKIKTHADEFIAVANGVPTPPDRARDVSEATEDAEAQPTAARVEESARDFVIRQLYRAISPYDFERFTADLLRALGYRARVTPRSADGGFDVVAHRDPLAIEPPIIKVQCKQIVNPIGAPDVQKLIGSLAQGGSEVGLFVTLGGYSRDAKNLDRNRNDLRLIEGDDVAQLVMDNYEALPSEWKKVLPLRRTWVIDADPESAQS